MIKKIYNMYCFGLFYKSKIFLLKNLKLFNKLYIHKIIFSKKNIYEFVIIFFKKYNFFYFNIYFYCKFI